MESKEHLEKLERLVCKGPRVLSEILASMVCQESVQRTLLFNKALQEYQDHQVNVGSTVSTVSTGKTVLLVKLVQQVLLGQQVGLGHKDLLASREMMAELDLMDLKEVVEMKDPLAQKATTDLLVRPVQPEFQVCSWSSFTFKFRSKYMIFF